jgi:5'-nucleotidase / UDP-sugar diphosphatase
MKNGLMLLALVVTMGVGAIGCAKKNNAAAAGGVHGSVTDVNVAPIPPKEPQVSYAAPAEPVFVEPTVTQTPEATATVPVSGTAGGQYVVKKGDTLFSIAKQAYGNGNQWQKIAQANPGLSPATLKAGRTITLP